MNSNEPIATRTSLPPLHVELLTLLLEQMLQTGAGIPAPAFRAEHYDNVSVLDDLEEHGWIKRNNDLYEVQSISLPMLDAEPARKMLADIEKIYAQLRVEYKKAALKSVRIDHLAAATGLQPNEVAGALRIMTDTSLWLAGMTLDFNIPEAYIVPSEGVLKYTTYANVIEEVRRAHARGRQMFVPARILDEPPAAAPVAPRFIASSAEAQVIRAWGPARACLQEFGFYEIKEITGLAGFDLTAAAHLEQRSSGGATKGQLLTAIDAQLGGMDAQRRSHFLTVLIEEILRRRPETEEKLFDYLGRLGWSFLDGALVPMALFDVDVLADTPTEAHPDLVKAAQRLRDGDLSGAVTSACAAVDAVVTQIYQVNSLGDPDKAKFQEGCKKASVAAGVLPDLEQQLVELGWKTDDAQRFKQNMEGALNQAAFVMQMLRSKMGDVHGTKPILRTLVFDCIRWAELITGSLLARPRS